VRLAQWLLIPDSDRIADMAGGPVRARGGPDPGILIIVLRVVPVRTASVLASFASSPASFPASFASFPALSFPALSLSPHRPQRPWTSSGSLASSAIGPAAFVQPVLVDASCASCLASPASFASCPASSLALEGHPSRRLMPAPIEACSAPLGRIAHPIGPVRTAKQAPFLVPDDAPNDRQRRGLGQQRSRLFQA
jgi:hypothetical protein